MSFAPILQLASSLRTDPSQTKPEEPKSKLRGLVPSPPLLRIVLVFVIPALLSTLAIQVLFLLWLVAPVTFNGSDLTHDYVVAPLVGLTKEGSVQTAAWIKATAPIVKDATIAFAEDAGVALYHFGGLAVEAIGTAGGVTVDAISTFGALALEGICTYGGITLEAIYSFGGVVAEASCLAFSATVENTLIFLELSKDGISSLASITFNGIKDALCSDLVFNGVCAIKEVVVSLVVRIQALLKASLSNGEQYRLLAGAINNIVGTNSNPRLFSEIVKSNVF